MLRFTNRVPRRLFGPKRDEVTGEWRKLHTEELNGLYSSNIVQVIKSRGMRWAGHVARMRRVEYRVLVGKPEGKRPFGRPRPRWEDNIEMDLREVGCGGIDWIEVGQEVERTCEYGNEHSGSIKCGEYLDWLKTG